MTQETELESTYFLKRYSESMKGFATSNLLLCEFGNKRTIVGPDYIKIEDVPYETDTLFWKLRS